MINLGIDNLTDWSPETNILIGLKATKQVSNITIASGQNLKAGTVLGLKELDGKYYIWDATKEDGTEVIAGILGCDVDASAADGVGFMYVDGEFNKRALIGAASFAGLTTFDIPLGSHNFGSIVIKEEID